MIGATSLKTAYDIEIRGVIEEYASVAAQIILEVAGETDGWPRSSSSVDQMAREIGVKNLLYDGFLLEDA